MNVFAEKSEGVIVQHYSEVGLVVGIWKNSFRLYLKTSDQIFGDMLSLQLQVFIDFFVPIFVVDCYIKDLFSVNTVSILRIALL